MIVGAIRCELRLHVVNDSLSGGGHPSPDPLENDISKLPSSYLLTLYDLLSLGEQTTKCR